MNETSLHDTKLVSWREGHSLEDATLAQSPQATGADAQLDGLAILPDGNLLHIGHPPAPGVTLREADTITRLRALGADIADIGHDSCSPPEAAARTVGQAHEIEKQTSRKYLLPSRPRPHVGCQVMDCTMMRRFMQTVVARTR